MVFRDRIVGMAMDRWTISMSAQRNRTIVTQRTLRQPTDCKLVIRLRGWRLTIADNQLNRRAALRSARSHLLGAQLHYRMHLHSRDKDLRRCFQALTRENYRPLQ